MPLKPCTTCHELWPDRALTNHRCPPCAQMREVARGTRRQRGIGPNHEALARRIKAERLPCTLCSKPYGDPSNPITVGHVVPRVASLSLGRDPDDPDNMRPECRNCNFGRGAR